MHCIERPENNRLLASLPQAEFKRLLPNLEPVELELGREIYSVGQVMPCVYFPTGAIISLLQRNADGSTAEIAMVGNDGILGVPLFLGGDISSSCAVVQTAGVAYRLSKFELSAEFERREVVMHLLLRYVQTLLTQMSQIAVCNRHHRIQQQVSRWLLMRLDCHPEAEIDTTHEHISAMLGVRREGVTEAAGRLQAAGWINYKRGKMKILNRGGLEQESCECYEIIKQEYKRLLPLPIIGMHTPVPLAELKFGRGPPGKLSKQPA